MAKPKGATLTRLFAVSDAERRAFWQELEAKKERRDDPQAEVAAPVSGIPVISTPDLRSTGIVNKESSESKECSDSGIPERSAPAPVVVRSATITGTPVSGIPTPSEIGGGLDTRPVSGIPFSGPPLTASLDLLQPEPPYLLTLPAQRRKIREAVRVQDGHSLGEQAVYATLWTLGQPERDDRRRVTIGYRTLSDACGLTVNNCKANLQALVRKLAIEPVAAHTSTVGTTYIVYSYPGILRRRRQAGMTHVIKTKGVVFVNPETGVPVSGTPVSTNPLYEAGTPERPAGTPASESSGVPDSVPLIRNQELREETIKIEELPASSSFPLVVTAGATAGIPLDDDAARRIVLRSRAFDEHCTEAEVAHFVRVKADQLRNSRTVGNVVGLLIKAVPQYFMPPATELASFRQRLAQATERQVQQGREESKRAIETARDCLSDPDASEAEREWAHSVLSNAWDPS